MHLNRNEIQKQSLLNNLQSLLYLFMIVGLITFLLFSFLGDFGIWLGIGFGLFTYMALGKASPQVLLRKHNARKINRNEDPELYELTDFLCQKAHMEKPITLYRFLSPLSNAFSAGTNNKPVVALSNGLIDSLTPRELTAVIAHEIAHIACGDLKLLAISQSMARFFSTIVQILQIIILIQIPLILLGALHIPMSFLMVIWFSPFLILLLQLKLSRIREFQADNFAVQLTQDPEGLISGLQKIEREQKHLFSFFRIWPQSENLPDWLLTHPKTEDRIAKLRSYKS
ncbi:MAG: M48 family metalloprotease [Deltaproteobacteria bacterium]|nr:M48 family metalloprotease [Deltaproteobacteria bacterium]